MRRIALMMAALGTARCAMTSDVDSLRSRVTLLEKKLADSESRQQADLEEAGKRDAAEHKGIRKDLASVGAKTDSLSQRVMVIEGRTDEAQSNVGKVSINQQRIAQIEENETKLKESVGQLDTRLSAMEKVITSGPIPSAKGPAPEPLDEEALYKASLASHNNGDYGAAREGFERLVREKPDSKLASNAEFWMGEGHLKQKHFDEALRHFTAVVEKFPDSNKYCSSIFKLGVTLEEMGQKQKAKTFYSELAKKCPDTPEAKEGSRRAR